MSVVIKIENLYKEYRLGVIGHGTLYRDIQSWWANARGKEDPNSLIGLADPNKGKDSILALNDINLDVNEGEVLGIIGANGAGKSTLLKILSKITAPTSGTIKYKGKVSSLLEVGTGFHTELTGRENIFLNGSINGMNKNQINNKLDEIVDFSGVEQFLDTPVKRYSSGMLVRLGFAVAAYLEPDILVVDEVLAVGDAEFQQKAISKMKSVSKQKGRTVLFVSHNMDSIKKLCSKAILLSKGKIIHKGLTEEVIDDYLGNKEYLDSYFGQRKWNQIDKAPGRDIVRMKSISTKNINNKIKDTFEINNPIIIEFEYCVLKSGKQLALTIGISNQAGNDLIWSFDEHVENEWGKQKPLDEGVYLSKCIIPENMLNESIYNISLTVFIPPAHPDNNHQVRASDILSFKIVDSFNNKSARGSYPYDWNNSLIRPKLNWSKKKLT